MSHTCLKCSDVFNSRNKLFKHIANFHFEEDAAEPCHKKNKASAEEESKIPTQNFDIEIVAEDLWYRIISKPQGMATMGSSGSETLLNSHKMLLPDAIKLKLSYKKAVPCHRLDQATGGLVICSKTKASEILIKDMFRQKNVKKRYRALVCGKIDEPEGEIDAQISGQPALTQYRVVDCTPSVRYGFVTTVDLWPITGKKHQLRRHLQGIGHPILGDNRYSAALTWPSGEYSGLLFLWALEVIFPHPNGYMAAVETDFEGKPTRAEIIDTNRGKCEERNGDDEDEDDADILIEGYIDMKKCKRITTGDQVHVEIPEPNYYHSFRQLEMQRWKVSEAASEMCSGSTKIQGDMMPAFANGAVSTSTTPDERLSGTVDASRIPDIRLHIHA